MGNGIVEDVIVAVRSGVVMDDSIRRMVTRYAWGSDHGDFEEEQGKVYRRGGVWGKIRNYP